MATPVQYNAPSMTCAAPVPLTSGGLDHKVPSAAPKISVQDVDIQTDSIYSTSLVQTDTCVIKTDTFSNQFPAMKRRSAQTDKVLAVPIDVQTDTIQWKESYCQCSPTSISISTAVQTDEHIGVDNGMVTEPYMSNKHVQTLYVKTKEKRTGRNYTRADKHTQSKTIMCATSEVQTDEIDEYEYDYEDYADFEEQCRYNESEIAIQQRAINLSIRSIEESQLKMEKIESNICTLKEVAGHGGIT